MRVFVASGTQAGLVRLVFHHDGHAVAVLALVYLYFFALCRLIALAKGKEMKINVNFRFPEGCKEEYHSAELPVIPHVGDFIERSRLQSGRYRVQAVVFGIDPETERCDRVLLELEALDKISS